jgi:uncharacterized lipoprotein YddW (UPF0748 family)
LAAWGGRAATYEPANVSVPAPMREFRGAWIATVANIDWPSAKGLSSAEQKAEMIALLDRAAQLKLNAVVFQVRPACDALYASEIEPWSEFLTGTMGKPPQPLYDPLSFAIEEAHKRGLELHAWFNPYRAGHPSAKSPASPNHVSHLHPSWVRHYGHALWLDPGEKEVQDYSLRVVMDVVHRYDVDGIHFDDYFYPYKENDAAGRELDFPDDASWQKFGAGGKLTRDDWRRENVNSFIARVYAGIKAAKPWVKFGVSPFGIWRPGSPAQISGFDAYDKLYADSRKWLSKGWVDYFAPQLYWSIDSPEQSFPVLLKWWSEQNPKGRHIYPGLDDTKTSPRRRSHEDSLWKPLEIVNQIRLTRKQSGAGGHLHWNMGTLLRNDALDDALLKNLYAQPALIPAFPWLDKIAPAKPVVSAVIEGPEGGNQKVKVSWSGGAAQKPWLWVLQSRNRDWKTEILPEGKTSITLAGLLPDVIAVSAVDRNGNCSAPAVLKRR